MGIVRILLRVVGQHPLCGGVVRLAVQREAQVIDEIIVPRVDEGVLGQLLELVVERLVEFVRMPAVMAVPGTGIEQRVAAEKRRLVGA